MATHSAGRSDAQLADPMAVSTVVLKVASSAVSWVIVWAVLKVACSVAKTVA